MLSLRTKRDLSTIRSYSSKTASVTKRVEEVYLPIFVDLIPTLLGGMANELDNETEVIHDRVPLNRVPALTEKEYYVRGCTALLDAVGGAIHHIGNVHKYAREEDRPEKTLFVITTDGMENASRRYTYDKVKAMIERQRETYGWEFLFLGANIDAAREAARFGIRADCAADYHADSIGTEAVYASVCEAVCQVRRSAPLAADWKQRIDADFKGRKR